MHWPAMPARFAAFTRSADQRMQKLDGIVDRSIALRECKQFNWRRLPLEFCGADRSDRKLVAQFSDDRCGSENGRAVGLGCLLDPRRDVHRIADDRVFLAAARSDVSRHHRSHVQPDPYACGWNVATLIQLLDYLQNL